jgi:hypothetical protein
VLCLLWLPVLPVLAQPYQGFGASTRGGEGKPVYRVTNLRDHGPGSLRDATSRGHRFIVFEVAGEILLSQDLYVLGPFLTIDGFSAPPPGITLKNHGLLIRGGKGAHDVIVRGLRSRNSIGCDRCPTTGSGINVSLGAYNVVIDRVSVQGFSDGAVGVGRGAHDVTIQWSIMAEGQNPQHNLPVLLSGVPRVTLHHNLIVKGHERMPQIKWSDGGEQAPDTQVDMRNNLIWDWRYAASQIWKGTRANVVGNYYYAPRASELQQRRAILFCHAGAKSPQCRGDKPAWFARAYIADNVSGAGRELSEYLNSLGSESRPFPAPAVQTTDACAAARQILAKAGVRPLDAVDQHILAEVSPVGCDQPRPMVHK